MSLRQTLGQDIAAGLAGWFQLQVSQNLGELSGEDSARFIVSQIVNAQGRYAPATSQLPKNWGATKKRVDVALKARSKGATTWYGAVEIKWPGSAFDPDQVRLQAVQDAMRVTFITTNYLKASFVVLGGSKDSLDTLFDKKHPNAQDREQRRQAFHALFSRDLKRPSGEADHTTWSSRFPDAGARVPPAVFANFTGKLKAELVSKADARVGDQEVGHVYVWQCKRVRGKAAGDAA